MHIVFYSELHGSLNSYTVLIDASHSLNRDDSLGRFDPEHVVAAVTIDVLQTEILLMSRQNASDYSVRGGYNFRGIAGICGSGPQLRMRNQDREGKKENEESFSHSYLSMNNGNWFERGAGKRVLDGRVAEERRRESVDFCAGIFKR